MKSNVFSPVFACLRFAVVPLVFAPAVVWAGVVEAEGRAAGDQVNAREQALADALREAIRVGVGTDILSSTGVKDFALEYDRIMSSAFGHVKTYKVLSSGLAKDGFYHVKVSADVDKGTPGAKNTLALRQLVQLKGAPRVAISVEEQIDGAQGQTRYAQGILEQVARDLQINLVDTGTARSQESRMAARDEILGNDRAAKLRSAGVAQKADFLIEGRVTARYVGRQSSFGSLPQHVFSVGGELQAKLPDTGEIVVSVALPGTENVESDLEAKEMAAREVIQKVLSGAKQKGQSPLFSKVLSRWITDNDLGSVKRLEFAGISNAQYEHLRGLLGEAEKVSAVWPREFDSQGLSVIDVETRLDSGALGVLLGEMSKGQISVDRATQHLVSCKVAGSSPAASAPPAPGAAPATPTGAGAAAPQGAAPGGKKWWWPF